MTDFFISYAREDEDFAVALVQSLEQHDWDAWIDNSDIPPSVPWMNEIQRAIDETMLVVEIASPDWIASEACQIEHELAENARVPTVRLLPDITCLDLAVENIIATYRDLPLERAIEVEATRSAAIWSAAGRKSALLVRGRPLATLRTALAKNPDRFSATAVAFLRASRQAAIRRRLLGFAVALIVPSLILSMWMTKSTVSAVNERVAKSISEAGSYADRETYAQWNIYAALEQARIDADSSFTSYYQLFRFMNERTPTNWQPVPADAVQVSSENSPNGTQIATADGSQVVISGPDGALRLSADSEVTGLAWSPDGAWLGLTTVSGAEVLSVKNGQSIALRGGSGTTLSFKWLDSENVQVGTNLGTGTWQVFDGAEVANTPGVRFGANTGDVLHTVDEFGAVTATNTLTGETHSWNTTTPPGALPTAMDAAGGRVAIAYGAPEPFLRVHDTTPAETTVDIPLVGCTPVALSLSPRETDAYLVCLEAETNRTRVELATGVVTSQPAPEQFLLGVRALDDRVLWGGSRGAIFESRTDLAQSEMLDASAGCGTPTRKLAGSSDGRRLFPIGDGTGSPGCATVIERTEDQIAVHRFIFEAGDGFAVPDATVSADGSLVAYGLSDGQVRVFRTDDYSPVFFGQVVPDQVRDLAFSTDDEHLIVAGAGGTIIAIPVPHTELAESGKKLIEAARLRLQNALDWGIYKKTTSEK